MSGKNGCKGRLEAVTRSDIWYPPLRDFLQAKLDRETNGRFLLNEHGDPII